MKGLERKSVVFSEELVARIEQFATEERRKFSPAVAILVEKALNERDRSKNRRRGNAAKPENQ